MIDLSLLEDFITGAGESLDEMETALLELEAEPDNNELLNTIFRSMHTIKGAAQFVGLEKVSALSHVLEDLLDLLREGKKEASLEIINLLIQAKDRISQLVSDLESTQSENTEVDDLIQLLNVQLGVASAPEPAEPTTEETETEDLTAFLSEEDEATEDLSAFLSEDDTNGEEDLATMLSDDEPGEDISSFLEEDDLSDKTPQPSYEEDTDDLASFLSEESDEAAIQEALEELEIENVESSEEKLLSEAEESSQTSNLDENDYDGFILPDEEYDQELFGIYILQLQEKFSLINKYVAQLDTASNSDDLLHNILEALESLKFSANYMAYDKLTHLYSQWIEEVLEAQDELAATGDTSFNFMNERMKRLREIFPQLKEIPENITTPIGDDDFQAEISQEAPSHKESEPELAFVNDLIQKEPDSKNSEAEIISLDTSIEEKPTQGIKSEDIEEDLFAKLSHALDASAIEESITSEPINEVFGSLLESTKEQRPIPEKQKPQLKVKTLAEANKEPEPEPPKAVTQAAAKKEEKTATPITDKKPTASSSEKVFKKSIRVDADKIDSLMNQVGELIVDRAYFFQLANEINELQQHLKEITGLGQKDLKPVRTFAYRLSEAIISLGRTSNELQEGVMKVRMLPISQLFNRYPRLVHDLSHANNKKVSLEIRGEETELDKMIIEEISDPLIHMIRNAIGHGIESPEDRIKAGKPETGNLLLEAYHESNHIVIEISDDGRGIDTERIKEKAENMKLFSKDELNRMSNDDLTRFIMMPGFSTAREINSTSGRGVGMDVVKKNIEKLNGTIEVESKFGVETKMRLKIPLTLAIIPALLVRVGVDSFTIPLANVEETLRVSQTEISIMEETEVMYLRGKTLPIFRLSTLFNIKSEKSDRTDYFVVVVNTGTQRIGLMVDSLLGQEEVVIKPLADYLHEGNCFSGATIIGDGRISLILDVYELVNMTTDKQIKKHHQQEQKSISSLETES